ncbi:MAG: hypothetical protein LUF87_01115 [Alistipes sp.]|nr:hypothetical protein [Alistipes sp.]
MEYQTILKNLISVLDRNYPSGAAKNNIVRKVLDIDKMGAYRRLNGLVQFKVHELALLCSHLQLPLETVFNLPKGKTVSLDLQMPDYSVYGMDDHDLHRRSLEILDMAARSPNSKLVIGCNMLPHSIITDYDFLLRFLLCKWMYFRNDSGQNTPLSKIMMNHELVKIKHEIVRRLAQFKSVVMVWDSRIIESLINDIVYFYKINLITDAEMDELYQELSRYLNQAQKLAADGCSHISGNPVYCYISSVSLDSNYGFIDSDTVKASILQAFILNIGWNTDDGSFEYVRSWMNTLIRSSTLISTSGEVARADFFNRQRKTIEILKA